MPASGIDLTPSNLLLTPPEIQRLAKLFVASGITKIRLTGGEPSIRADLVEIVGEREKFRHPIASQSICR